MVGEFRSLLCGVQKSAAASWLPETFRQGTVVALAGAQFTLEKNHELEFQNVRVIS